jgi:large subunit ribosomal protein L18e
MPGFNSPCPFLAYYFHRGKAGSNPSPCIILFEVLKMKHGTEVGNLKKLIFSLEKASKKSDAKIWGMVAYYLRKPARRRIEINLNRLNRIVDDGEVIVIPGKVLGMGILTKKVKIAAQWFSKSAIIKLAKAGIEIMPIEKLLQANQKGSKVKIVI